MTMFDVHCSAFAEHNGTVAIQDGAIWQAGCQDCAISTVSAVRMWALYPGAHWHGDMLVLADPCPFTTCTGERDDASA